VCVGDVRACVCVYERPHQGGRDQKRKKKKRDRGGSCARGAAQAFVSVGALSSS